MTPEQLIAADRAPVQYADAMAELQRRVGLARALADRLEAATRPQVLTDREAMVWAAAFARALERIENRDDDACRVLASKVACEIVRDLRGVNLLRIDAAARAMLAAMTGGGR